MQERPERIEKRLEDIEREARAKEEEQVGPTLPTFYIANYQTNFN